MMEDMKNNKQHYFWSSSLNNMEELPELSLAPTTQQRRMVIDKSVSSSSSAESETNSSRKRKFLFKSEQEITTTTTTTNHASVDLHLKDRLPLDWEQCLDLQSGRMYYLNRRTLRKSWEWPNKDHHHHHQHNNNHKLDLELNISPLSSSTYSEDHHRSNCSKLSLIGDAKTMNYSSSSSGSSCNSRNSNNNNNMVALACLNCHLLVIFSKSSPSCPNCKYVHSIPTPTQQQHDVLVSSSPVLQKNTNVKPLHTLSLLN